MEQFYRLLVVVQKTLARLENLLNGRKVLAPSVILGTFHQDEILQQRIVFSRDDQMLPLVKGAVP